MNNEQKMDTERRFIALLLKHKDIVSKWVESDLPLECFEEIHIPILHAIRHAFNNDVILTKATYLEFLRTTGHKALEIGNQEGYYLKVDILGSQVTRDDYPNLRQKIFNVYLGDNTRSYIEDYAKSLETRDPLTAVRNLSDNLSGLVEESVKEVKSEYENIVDFAPAYVDEIMRKSELGEEADERILTHIKEIDETMAVGLAPGTLTLICGDVGSYKTTMMLNIGLNVWHLEDENVLFVPLEMPKDLVMNKIVARELSINSRSLMSPRTLTEEQKKQLLGFKEDWGKDVESSFFVMETLDRIGVNAIKREIQRHVDIFQPKVVVIDYVGIMTPDGPRANDRPDLQIGEMLKDLRAMGRPRAITKEGFAIVSGAQIGREALKRIRRVGVNKTAFYSEDIRGSHEYSADADVIYAQIPDDQNPNQLNLYCIKSRYGAKTFTDGSNRAVLDVVRETGWIRSREANFSRADKADIAQLVGTKFDDFDDITDEPEVETPVGDATSIDDLLDDVEVKADSELDDMDLDIDLGI